MGKKRSERKLTAKQQKFIEAYLKTDNISEAARIAGYLADHPENASQAGNQALKATQGRSREAMDRMGWTFEKLIGKHLVLVIEGKETKFFPYLKTVRYEEVKDKEGKVLQPARVEVTQEITRIEVISLGSKATGCHMAFKLRGDYAPTQVDTDPLPGGGTYELVDDAPCYNAHRH